MFHRRGAQHVYANVLSRIKDPLEECDCYTVGQKFRDLPCGGFHYCTRVNKQWVRLMSMIGAFGGAQCGGGVAGSGDVRAPGGLKLGRKCIFPRT